MKVNGIHGSGFEGNGKRVKNDGGNKKGKERDAQPVPDQGEGDISATKHCNKKMGPAESMQLILGAVMEKQDNVTAVAVILFK